MTTEPDAQIGRTIMVGLRGSRPGAPELERDLDACAEARVGGVILFDRDLPTGGPRNIESPSQLTELIAHLRTRLGRGLIVAIDQEGGGVARLGPAHGFRQSRPAAELAPIEPAQRLAEARAEADQLAAAGIDLNFAPCVDLDLACPVISGRRRAFADDPHRVTECAREVLTAHAAAGVAACIKHYPGHGSAAGDTHLGLVDITGTHTDRELEPFRALAPIAPAVMVGHLLDRRVDPDLPASLSPAHIARLRDGLGFRGAIISDSIDMDALAHEPGEAAVLGLRVGVDLVVHGVNRPGDPIPCPAPAMAAAARRAVEDGMLPAARVAEAAARADRLVRPEQPSGGVGPGP